MNNANRKAPTTTGITMGRRIIRIKRMMPMTMMALIPRLANTIVFPVYRIRIKLPIKKVF